MEGVSDGDEDLNVGSGLAHELVQVAVLRIVFVTLPIVVGDYLLSATYRLPDGFYRQTGH